MRPNHRERECTTGLAHGFRNVDGAKDPARFAAYLDAVAVQLKEHKRESYNMLELLPGCTVLDVGCGTGDDARALAAQVAPGGHVVGIDISARLIADAKARAGATQTFAQFIVGDAHATGLTADRFDGARIERCLQHVERPGAVIAEMRRVVRTGGWVVAAEPDWETLAIDATDHALTRSITRTLSDRAAHGRIGRHLPALMVTAGLQDLTIRPITLLTRSLAVATDIFQLGSATEDPRVRASYARERIQAWIFELEQRDAKGRFFGALGGFLVRARVP
jgi:ubiquinone/menaquinone biosynthesis C-methylase UbiE